VNVQRITRLLTLALVLGLSWGARARADNGWGCEGFWCWDTSEYAIAICASGDPAAENYCITICNTIGPGAYAAYWQCSGGDHIDCQCMTLPE
jgi:hypothetical protein